MCIVLIFFSCAFDDKTRLSVFFLFLSTKIKTETSFLRRDMNFRSIFRYFHFVFGCFFSVNLLSILLRINLNISSNQNRHFVAFEEFNLFEKLNCQQYLRSQSQHPKSQLTICDFWSIYSAFSCDTFIFNGRFREYFELISVNK